MIRKIRALKRKKVGKKWLIRYGRRNWMKMRSAGCVWSSAGCIETNQSGMRKIRRHCADCGEFVWRLEHLDRFWTKLDWDREPAHCQNCWDRLRNKRPPIFHCPKCSYKGKKAEVVNGHYYFCPKCEAKLKVVFKKEKPAIINK